MAAIKKELADVLIYAYQMAIFLDLDPDEIVRAKLELARQKYPADLMKSQEHGQAYYDIRAKYRSETKTDDDISA